MSSFLACSALTKESSCPAEAILIWASLVIDLIFRSPPITATFAFWRLFGSPSMGTLLLNATPLIRDESPSDPFPDLNIDTFSAPGFSTLSETIPSEATTSPERRSRAASAPLPIIAVSATWRSRVLSRGVAISSIISSDDCMDFLYPSMIVRGWRPFLSRVWASWRSAPQRSMVVVTPSPHASSCDWHMETSILAAGCFTRSSETIFAPSLVTAVFPSVL